MKIYAIKPQFSLRNLNTCSSVSNTSVSYVTNQLNNDESFSLPSFHSLGQSLTFKGAEPGSNVKNVLKKIEETKNAIKALEGSSGITKSPEVIEAYQKIADLEYWESTKDKTYEYARDEAEKARVANKRWYGSYGVNAYNKKMNELYYSLNNKYTLNRFDEEQYRTIITLYERQVSVDDKSRAAQIQTLKEKLVELEANIDFASLYDEVNKTVNHTGGMEERIAGYADVKDEITRTFVNPLKASMKDPSVHVPPAVMLYGALGCGKTTFLEAIGEQLKDCVKVVDLSNKLDPDVKSFISQLNNHFVAAQKYYRDTGKRTIFLINEAEQYFCMKKEDIGDSGMFLNESDLQKLEEYGSTTSTTANVNNFKSTFDYVSKIPTDPDSKGCASTVFITTNYPHLIHRDLLIRDGKYGKMLNIAVKPAADDNLRAVIKHYLKLYSDLLETIKMLSTKSNYADLIKSLPYISNKGKDVLISKVKNGTIVNMHIDPTGSEFRNFDQFIKGNNLSLVRGAYSNARIQNIADKAFAEYLENPTIPFETHFCNVKNRRGVDINSKSYRYFNDIYNMVENPEMFRKDFSTIKESVQEMVQAYLDGELREDELKKLKLVKKDITEKYENLKAKTEKTSVEKKALEQYEEFLDSINELDI